MGFHGNPDRERSATDGAVVPQPRLMIMVRQGGSATVFLFLSNVILTCALKD